MKNSMINIIQTLTTLVFTFIPYHSFADGCVGVDEGPGSWNKQTNQWIFPPTFYKIECSEFAIPPAGEEYIYFYNMTAGHAVLHRIDSRFDDLIPVKEGDFVKEGQLIAGVVGFDDEIRAATSGVLIQLKARHWEIISCGQVIYVMKRETTNP